MNIAMLMTAKNTHGREYAKQLLENGIKIDSIIIETGSKQAEYSYKYNTWRIQGQYNPPPLVDVVDGYFIPLYYTKSHGGSKCEKLLKYLKPDLIIMGGAGAILTNRILSIPTIGCINCHPGILPQFRGFAPVAWSIYYDHPVGASCHFAKETIDTGPILCQEVLEVHRGDSYEKVESDNLVLCGRLIVKAVRMIETEDYKQHLKIQGEGKTYNKPDDELFEIVKQKLINQEYKCYSD